MIPHKAFLWNLGVLSLICMDIIINVTFSHERIRFRRVPDEKTFTNTELRVSLYGLFNTYQDISTDLCHLESTQANEYLIVWCHKKLQRRDKISRSIF